MTIKLQYICKRCGHMRSTDNIREARRLVCAQCKAKLRERRLLRKLTRAAGVSINDLTQFLTQMRDKLSS